MRAMGMVAAMVVVAACGGDDTSSGGGGTATGTTTGGGGEGGTGGTVAPGPRCAGLAATCGPNGDDDCCARNAVEGGTYFRSYDGITHTDMTHPATVSAFEMDTYEVTVGRFRTFVEAGMGVQDAAPASNAGAHPLIADSGWFSGWDSLLSPDRAAFEQALACDAMATWTDAPGANEALPMTCVTWYEAFAFCAWDGGRLPTEAEWNFASAGGDEQREYPWGSGLDESNAVYGCLADGNPDCGMGDILPVGSRSPAGDGRYGQADLAGGVWELVFDWFEAYADPCVDCAQTEVTMFHTARGGGWGSPAQGVTSSNRDFVTPSSRSPDFGFRCAASP